MGCASRQMLDAVRHALQLTEDRMNDTPRYSIVAPIFNEEGNIALLFERIDTVMESTGEPGS